MSADQHAACLLDFPEAARQYFPECIGTFCFGPADDVHSRQHFAAHRKDIAQGIGSSDFPEKRGIRDHCGKEVQRLDHGRLGVYPEHCRIIGRVETDQKIRVFLFRKLAEKIAQHAGADFRIAPPADK